MDSNLVKFIYLSFFITTFLSRVNCLKNRENYEGYKVFRLNPTSEKDKGILSQLQDGNFKLDFWSEPNALGLPVDVMVAPEFQMDFMNLMYQNRIDTQVFIDDIERRIKNEQVGKLSRAGMTWTSYYELDDIYSWMETLTRVYPDKIKVFKVGPTHEDREIKGVKISFGPGRRAVFLEGGIHAREWISPATVTYIINELLVSKDKRFRRVAESFDWYIVPVTNPDGYAFTHDYYRLWRKTKKQYVPCRGADPNRNWKVHWGEEGTSNNTCAENYGGPKPFSEIETYSLANFIRKIGHTLDVYLAFHSYSQLLLMPYGHTEEHLDNYGDVLAIGKKAVEAIAVRYGTEYKVGNIAETIYKASGGSMDWVKYKYKVPIAYTYELRDQGKNGFLLPAEQIIPNCEEVMDSLLAIFYESEKMGYFKLKTEPSTSNNRSDS